MEKVFEIYIKTTPERLWEAIIDSELRAKYNFGVGVQSEWTSGSGYYAAHVASGTPIVIPEVPDLPLRAGEAASGGTFDELKTQAQQALTYARSVVEDAGQQAVLEAKNSLEVLRSRDFRALAGTTDLNVEALTKRINDAAKDAEAQAKGELANLDTLSRAVDELLSAIGGARPATSRPETKSQSTRRTR